VRETLSEIMMEVTSMDMPIELEFRLEMENELEVLRRLRTYNTYREELIGKDIEWLEEELS
tara:strand:+ start:808 stop:990 length:183 start_codon:yes stop_codon:yes gene_type:complete